MDSVQDFLKAIGRIPLLKHEEEIYLGRSVQRANQLQVIQQELGDRLGQLPSLAQWAAEASITEEELNVALEQGAQARRQMVEANLRLVVSIAKKYLKSGMDLLDLVQEGTLGLHRAVEKFEPAKGYRFSTYAYWWIRQAVTRAIAEKGRTIRLPIHITEKLNKLRRTQRELSQSLGRTPKVGELAEALALEPATVRDYLEQMRSPISLDVTVGEQRETLLLDLLEDLDQDPQEQVSQTLMAVDLRAALATLPQPQRQILTLRYGLDATQLQGMTLAKIGEELGMSRERVRQLERSALRQLRLDWPDFQAYLAG
jgi:RNA polymerase nonessential primary-like sigma factor